MLSLILKLLRHLAPLLFLAIPPIANADLLGFGGTSWKEEVLLHDGQKIIVKRSLNRGGRHEIGQRSGATNETLIFTMPGTDQTFAWNDKLSEDIGSSNFNLLMLEIANGSAYLVTSPMGCLSYNKWGRPNPPYVVFKYKGTDWSRIPLQELPAELTAPNLVISSPDNAAKDASGGVIEVETIKRLNGRARRPEYKSIVREPLPSIGEQCGVEFSNGKGAWLSFDWFKDAKDLAACIQVCERNEFNNSTCPCGQFFK